ncbi:hypothetical protein BBI01_01200 [Chryseobacterium artocarpi]|uniref:Uncharacterized protein n=1 Tax=Chryseobacterium artocarpi TaxID=1414727 RepID=A0A1B8ZZT0_9FLAO|nr:hypothetical protein [Chryseobacterium artocarpi]OCA77108.1 hypothetical protein BBI01_01200 [Chryseobacterium artocarpi]
MRKLSDEEKKFTKELVRISTHSQNVFLSNIIDNELTNTDVFLDYEKNEVYYHFDKEIYDHNPGQFIELARSFSWKMIRYFHLLQYFQKMEMLFLYQESPIEKQSRFGRLIRGRVVIPNKINDTEAAKIILEYSSKTILINTSLVEYVNNDFQTVDDIRNEKEITLSEENLKVANKTLKTAQLTMYITICIAIITTIINLWLAFKPSH